METQLKEKILRVLTKGNKITYSISLTFLIIFLIIVFWQKEIFGPPFFTVLIIIIPLFIGVCITLIMSPPGKLQSHLIISTTRDYIAPLVETTVQKSIKQALAELLSPENLPCIKHIEKTMDNTISLISEKVYSNSIDIVRSIEPDTIKIVMKAEEFSLDCLNEHENTSDAIAWFKFLNSYVQQRGKKYIRIIAINPKTQDEAHSNLEWIKKLCKYLESEKISNCNIIVILRDITISWVLLDRKITFFAFLIDNKFSHFAKITCVQNLMLNRGINDWFDQKFQDLNGTFLIYCNGKIDTNNFQLLKNTVESRPCSTISQE